MEIRELDGLSITVVVDNFYDALIDDPPCGKRFRTTPEHSIYAEHGLSFFIIAFIEGKKYPFFFDFGVDGELLLHNLRVLKIDAKSACAFLLSHGHFDHYGGLKGLVKHLYPLGIRGIPLYTGVDYFTRRFSKRERNEKPVDLGELKREDLEGVTRTYEVEKPIEFFPGCYLVADIKMESYYEKLPDNFFVEKEGRLIQDNFREEIALFFMIKGAGPVVISGCAHRGIVNTLNHIAGMTEVKKLHAVLGGFHLGFSDEKRIMATISDLENFSPDFVVPCHCTGFYARLLFAEIFGERCILNTAGTTYTFGKL